MSIIEQPATPSLVSRNGDARFSIFSPVITVEHREFYEKIVSELNGVFPICTQGKWKHSQVVSGCNCNSAVVP